MFALISRRFAFSAVLLLHLGAGAANAATVNVVLVAAETMGSGITSPSPYQIDQSTATWSFNTSSGVLSGSGQYVAKSQINPLPQSHIATYYVSDLSIGGGISATATSFECVDGAFGATIGANVCGGYFYGDNGADESIVDYTINNGIPGTRILGGDDVINSAMQQLTLYDGMSSNWDGSTLVISNYSFETGGITMTFVSAVPVPAAVWLFASGLGLLAWIRRKRIVQVAS